MKKLFCVLTALCLLASIVAVGTMSVAATKEQDEQILVGGEPTATTPAKIPQFRVVKAKVRPYTTPDKYVDTNDYTSVRAEYVVWFFNDERGEERYLFAKAATPREEVTYWLPGKNPDYSTIDYTDEQWYPHIVFETPAKTVVGLPDDAECVTDWYYYGESEYTHEINEASLRNSIEAKIAMQNNEDGEFGGLVSGALLVNPYLELGGTYDLDNDGIAEEVGWDRNGDEITEIVAIGVDPTATLVEVVPGDANGDGVVNMKDVLTIRKYVAGITVGIDLVAADTNGDGAVNMKDVLTVRKFVANIITVIDGGKGGEISYPKNALLSKAICHNGDGTVNWWYEYTYDEDGKETSYRRYNEDETVDWVNSYDYIYDENAKLKSLRYYNDDGTVRYWIEYNYDKSDNMICRCSFRADGSLESSCDYTYDENGRMTSGRCCSSDGSVWDWYEYTYDENGNRTSERRYNEDGSVWDLYEYTYDENGNQTSCRGDNDFAWDSIYDEGGKLTRKQYYNEDGVVDRWFEYTYDERGNMTSERYYNADGSVDWWYEYAYDENGNQTSYRFYNADGVVLWDSSGSYSYDENGNKTSYRDYNADSSVRCWIEYIYLNQSAPEKE